MSNTNNRFWGLARDQFVTKQLQLATDHTIFMMANEGTDIDDLDEVESHFEEGALVSVDEVLDVVRSLERRVLLPGKLHMVGVMPFDADGPKIYAVVDFKDFVEPENDTN